MRFPEENYVNDVEFSPDGRLLAADVRDGIMPVWSVPDGVEVARVGSGIQGWGEVAFSSDGSSLVSTDSSRFARIWKVDPTGLRAQACQTLSRNLTRAEWKEFLPNEAYNRTCPNLPADQ
jgi:WD40 repeat protein